MLSGDRKIVVLLEKSFFFFFPLSLEFWKMTTAPLDFMPEVIWKLFLKCFSNFLRLSRRCTMYILRKSVTFKLCILPFHLLWFFFNPSSHCGEMDFVLILFSNNKQQLVFSAVHHFQRSVLISTERSCSSGRNAQVTITKQITFCMQACFPPSPPRKPERWVRGKAGKNL